jgi:hypothetical protein
MKLIEFGPTLFRLPDEFTGGVPEALRLLADEYEKGFERTSIQRKGGRPSNAAKMFDEFRRERVERFWKVVEEGGRLDGLLELMEGDSSGLEVVDNWE